VTHKSKFLEATGSVENESVVISLGVSRSLGELRTCCGKMAFFGAHLGNPVVNVTAHNWTLEGHPILTRVGGVLEAGFVETGSEVILAGVFPRINDVSTCCGEVVVSWAQPGNLEVNVAVQSWPRGGQAGMTVVFGVLERGAETGRTFRDGTDTNWRMWMFEPVRFITVGIVSWTKWPPPTSTGTASDEFCGTPTHVLETAGFEVIIIRGAPSMDAPTTVSD